MCKYSDRRKAAEPSRTAVEHDVHALTRRQFVSIAGLGVAGALLGGCADDPASPGGDQPPIGTPKVALARAQDYDRALIRARMEAMFEQIGGIADVVKPGDTVAIKINLTGDSGTAQRYVRPAIESYWTHPEVTRAAVELILDAGASKVYIVEAVSDTGSFHVAGLVDVANTTGAQLVDLNRPAPYSGFSSATVPSAQVYGAFNCNGLLGEVDVLVSLAKMKCHLLAGVTHSIKNLVGAIPAQFYHLNPTDGHRSALHGPGKTYATRLPRVINDLFSAFPLHLSIVDGVMTTERGEGPWIGQMRPIAPGVLVAGKNAVATDAVATAVQGFDPAAGDYQNPFNNAENHLRIASARGKGPNRIDQIEIVGEALADLVHPFQPAPIEA